jgi:hypothetical protein
LGYRHTTVDLRRKVRPWFLREDGVTPRPAKIVYDVLGVIAVQASLSYIAVSFVVRLPPSPLSLFALRSLFFVLF